MANKREALIEMLLPEVRQDCRCQMFSNEPHSRTCSTSERAIDLADDILLLFPPGSTGSDTTT